MLGYMENRLVTLTETPNPTSITLDPCGTTVGSKARRECKELRITDVNPVYICQLCNNHDEGR